MIFYTEKTVSLIYGKRKNFFELKKVLLIQKKILWSKEINLFTSKKVFLNQQNFLQFKEIFSVTIYQRNFFLGVTCPRLLAILNFKNPKQFKYSKYQTDQLCTKKVLKSNIFWSKFGQFNFLWNRIASDSWNFELWFCLEVEMLLSF